MMYNRKSAAAQTPEPKTLIYTYIQGFGRGGLGYYTLRIYGEELERKVCLTDEKQGSD